jgi:hypothetical protein
MKLNGLPISLSGLKQSVILTRAADMTFEAWARQHSVTTQDLENFFTFIVLTDQFKRIDSLLKDSSTTLQSILT